PWGTRRCRRGGARGNPRAGNGSAGSHRRCGPGGTGARSTIQSWSGSPRVSLTRVPSGPSGGANPATGGRSPGRAGRPSVEDDSLDGAPAVAPHRDRGVRPEPPGRGAVVEEVGSPATVPELGHLKGFGQVVDEAHDLEGPVGLAIGDLDLPGHGQ